MTPGAQSDEGRFRSVVYAFIVSVHLGLLDISPVLE